MRVTVNTAHVEPKPRQRGRSFLSPGDVIINQHPSEPHRPAEIHGAVSLDQWLEWAAWKASKMMRGRIPASPAGAQSLLDCDLFARCPRGGNNPYVTVDMSENVQNRSLRVVIKAVVSLSTKEIRGRVAFEVTP